MSKRAKRIRLLALLRRCKNRIGQLNPVAALDDPLVAELRAAIAKLARQAER